MVIYLCLWVGGHFGWSVGAGSHALAYERNKCCVFNQVLKREGMEAIWVDMLWGGVLQACCGPALVWGGVEAGVCGRVLGARE